MLCKICVSICGQIYQLYACDLGVTINKALQNTEITNKFTSFPPRAWWFCVFDLVNSRNLFLCMFWGEKLSLSFTERFSCSSTILHSLCLPPYLEILYLSYTIMCHLTTNTFWKNVSSLGNCMIMQTSQRVHTQI